MAEFVNRVEAGKRLARALEPYSGREDLVILALPRGGVPIGYEIARSLKAPLDIFQVRKLGAPGQGELAIGAVASGGVRVLNDRIIASLGLPELTVERITALERAELARREKAYRGGRSGIDLCGKTVVVVDDGMATGATMRAAVDALRALGCAGIIAAVPLAPREAYEDFQHLVDEMVCLETPDPFVSVGEWYEEFSETSDDEVREILAREATERAKP